jgi:hypothetical protein
MSGKNLSLVSKSWLGLPNYRPTLTPEKFAAGAGEYSEGRASQRRAMAKC